MLTRIASGLWLLWGGVLFGAGLAHSIAATAVAADEPGRAVLDSRHGLMLSVGFMIVCASLLYFYVGGRTWKDAATWRGWMRLVPTYMLVQFVLFAVADDPLFLIGAGAEALILVTSQLAFAGRK